MAKDWLSDQEVEAEIESLRTSPMVQLARKEQHLQYKRRQVLYNLRNLEKRGQKLAERGITMDNIDVMLFGDADDFED